MGVRPATEISDSYGRAARQPQRSKRSWRRQSFASTFSVKARHRTHAVGVARLRRWLASAFVKQRWPGGADAHDPGVAEALAGLGRQRSKR